MSWPSWVMPEAVVPGQQRLAWRGLASVPVEEQREGWIPTTFIHWVSVDGALYYDVFISSDRAYFWRLCADPAVRYTPLSRRALFL